MKGFDDLFQVHGCSLYMYMKDGEIYKLYM